MKAFAVLAICVASVAANGYGQPALIRLENSYSAPLRADSYGSYGSASLRSEIPITRFSNEIRGSESNSLQYETGNGISLTDNTQVVQGRGGSYDDGYGNLVRSEAEVTKQGSFSYTSPEGKQISTNWVADANGFRAEGAHLPRPVELPAEHAEAHRLALSRVSSSSYGSYESPALVRSSYDAPAVRVQSSYEAPAIRVQSYEAPLIRSGY